MDSIFCGLSSGEIEQRNASDFSLIRKFETLARTIEVLAPSPNGRLLAYGMQNGAVFVCDLVSGQMKTYHTFQNAANALAWTRDSQFLVAGGSEHTVRIFRISDQSCVKELSVPDSAGYPVHGLTFNTNYSLLLVGLSLPSLTTFDTVSWEPRFTIGLPWRCVSFSAHPTNANWVAVGGDDGFAGLVDLETQKLLRKFGNHGGAMVVDTVQFSTDGKRLLSGSDVTAIFIHDVESKAALMSIDSSTAQLVDFNIARFNRDCTQILAGCQSQGLKVFSAKDGRLLTHLAAVKTRSVALQTMAPWENIAPLRPFCVSQLSEARHNLVDLSRLPAHVRDEVNAARRR
eukprot:TRINITY_DN3118_c0_g1_i7.p1 TRINITY_DN3118_c0_g1~~TRINITY_DN3118_c0_g1_i7.p1  ORF type:complete len:352 (+),score=60.58 TRINITY_DN3118_c0_g1_i7:25-1056(+)